MKYTLPADFRISTIEQIKCNGVKGSDNSVVEIYGNILSPYRSGRGQLKTDQMPETLDQLKWYVRALAAEHIAFNYTLNASCMALHETDAQRLKDILYFIGQLQQIGITRVTVATPQLMEMIQKLYPDIEITCSTIMGVNSVLRAKQAIDLGAKKIVLQEDITRNFELIEKICLYATTHHVEIEVIANSMCLFQCFFRNAHYNALAHAGNEQEELMYYYVNRCARIKERNPVEYLKMQWIRPEDVKKYREKGVHLLKIVGRERVLEMQLPRLTACYLKEEFDGNLLDLIYGFSAENTLCLENRKLDKFLDYFNESYQCDKNVCGYGCTYCYDYYKRVNES